jgi:cyanophycinase
MKRNLFLLFLLISLVSVSCDLATIDNFADEGFNADQFPGYDFTKIENATLHYFGVGDTVTLNSTESVTGSLLIVGGALANTPEIYEEFIVLAGGVENAKIAIMPTASGDPIERSYTDIDRLVDTYGVPAENILIVKVAVMDDYSTPDVDESNWFENGFIDDETHTAIQEFRDFEPTAVWFVGGQQDRIINSLIDENGNDSILLQEIRMVKENGGVIGGTSAGAAIMSDVMITDGTSLGALTQEVLYVDHGSDPRLLITKGLGLFPFGITDQHFIERGRFGRLLKACQSESVPMGFGIEENSAIIVRGKTIEVIGVEASRSGMIMVDLDGGGMADYVQNSRRYLDTVGYEYEITNSLHSDIFSSDALINVICEGLVDCEEREAEGIAFEKMEDYNNLAVGVRVKFKQDENTIGWYRAIDGVYTYTAVNIKVDIEPISLTITEVNNIRSVNRGISLNNQRTRR